MYSEFVIPERLTRECHAASIAFSRRTPCVAYFAGSGERNDDVCIYFTRRKKSGWAAPIAIASGVGKDGRRYCCWNPVLFEVGEKLELFYKVGPDPKNWWGMTMCSSDGGNTWSEPERLPEGILGPIKNKPVLLEDGTLLCPSSVEKPRWQIHLERRLPDGTWSRGEFLCDGVEWEAIQPTILRFSDEHIELLSRTMNGVVGVNVSTDGGVSFAPMKASNLPNPNCGIDGVVLNDGRGLLVYNHIGLPPAPSPRWGKRTPLSLAIGQGLQWEHLLDLETEEGEYSYPAIVLDEAGDVHMVYTWKRATLKYVQLNLNQLAALCQ